MARRGGGGGGRSRGVTLLMGLIVVCMVWYMFSPLLFLYIKSNSNWDSKPPPVSCPPCSDCSYYCASRDIFSLPLFKALYNTYTDCSKNDSSLRKELTRSRAELVLEELELLKEVSRNKLKHTGALVHHLKQTFTEYIKEAKKCDAGIQTCERARERAEEELRKEFQVTAKWEKRARLHGWEEN